MSEITNMYEKMGMRPEALKFGNTIEKDLKGISKSVKIIVPLPDTPKADITD